MTNPDRPFRRFQRNGDPGALAAVFDAAAPELLAVARHLCGDEAEAEDAVQATFEVAIAKAHEHEPGRRVMPWLVGILGVNARKARERAARDADPERLAERLAERVVDDPADVAAAEELRALVRDEIEKLPDTYSAPLRRLVVDGATRPDIARSLGISVDALHVRIHRGMRLLKRTLPAGAALGGALTVSAPRGLAAVRTSVLSEGASSGVVGAGASGTALWISKPALAALVALGAGATAIGLAVTDRDSRPADSEALAAAQPGLVTTTSAGLDEAASRLADVRPGPVERIEAQAADAGGVAASSAGGDGRYGGLTPDEWLARFEAADGFNAIIGIGNQIAALPDDEALELMRTIYADLPTTLHRQQVLKSFVFHGGQPYVLEILDLAANDPTFDVQSWAWTYLERYAFVDFSIDPQAYATWRARTAGLPLGAVLEDSFAEIATLLTVGSSDDVAAFLKRFHPPDTRLGKAAEIDVLQAVRDAGVFDLLLERLDGPTTAAIQAVDWISQCEPDQVLLKSRVLPLIDGMPADSGDTESIELAAIALWCLGDNGEAWLADELMSRLLLEPERRATQLGFASAIADVGDPGVVPDLVEVLCGIGDEQARRQLATDAIGPLLGLSSVDHHDCDWWQEWLERNDARLRTAIRTYAEGGR